MPVNGTVDESPSINTSADTFQTTFNPQSTVNPYYSGATMDAWLSLIKPLSSKSALKESTMDLNEVFKDIPVKSAALANALGIVKERVATLELQIRSLKTEKASQMNIIKNLRDDIESMANQLTDYEINSLKVKDLTEGFNGVYRALNIKGPTITHAGQFPSFVDAVWLSVVKRQESEDVLP